MIELPEYGLRAPGMISMMQQVMHPEWLRHHLVRFCLTAPNARFYFFGHCVNAGHFSMPMWATCPDRPDRKVGD
jgi:hypothetical protein